MKFIVAIVVLLISFITGIIANLKLLDIKIEDCKKCEVKGLTSGITIATLKTDLTKIKHIQWFWICFVSILHMVLTMVLWDIKTPTIDMIRFLSISILLVPIMFIDWKTHTIPNVLVAAVLCLGTIILFVEFIFRKDFFLYSLIESFMGLCACGVLFYLLARLTKGGIGMGDVKLIAALGWMLGTSMTILVVMFSMVICSIVSIGLLVGKKKNKDAQIAFGPFLFFGYICTLFLLV